MTVKELKNKLQTIKKDSRFSINFKGLKDIPVIHIGYHYIENEIVLECNDDTEYIMTVKEAQKALSWYVDKAKIYLELNGTVYTNIKIIVDSSNDENISLEIS